MRFLLSILKGALTAVGAVLDGVVCMFSVLLGSLMAAAFKRPSVPPADDTAARAEEGYETVDIDRLEESAIVKSWAAARLDDTGFQMPVGRLGGWLRELDTGHAIRIAAADECGLLKAHLAGISQFPKLPPVGDGEATRRWIAEHAPARRPAKAAAAPEEDITDERAIEMAAAFEAAEPTPGAYRM
jgi:hypothetical protein